MRVYLPKERNACACLFQSYLEENGEKKIIVFFFISNGQETIALTNRLGYLQQFLSIQ